MLVAHLNALEDRLLGRWRQLQAADTAEAARAQALLTALRQEMLEPLMGAEWLLAAGEVIASNSLPDQPRPQLDVLLCQRHAPRLVTDPPGEGVQVLAEAVVTALTVVSVLDEAAVQRAVRSACQLKALPRHVLRVAWVDDGRIGRGLPAIPCQLLAFDGPADMAVAHGWLKQAYKDQGLTEADLPPLGAERQRVASPGLDGVFVLGRGFLNFDNQPAGFFDDEARITGFGSCWAIANSERGALMSLYLQLQQAANAAAGNRWDIRPYLDHFAVGELRLGN